jgi:hypothetical protein
MKVTMLFSGLVLMVGMLAAERSSATSVATITREMSSGVTSAEVRLERGPVSRPHSDLPANLDARGSGTVLWHRNLANTIYTSTGVSDAEGVVFSGTYLNAPRQVETVPLGGDGTEDWVHAGNEFFVDASRDGNVLAAVDFDPADSVATIREWRPGSSTPLWSYVVYPCRTLVYQGWASRKPIRVSDDGSTIAVGITMWADGGQQGRLLAFDSGSGTPVVDDDLPTGSIVATEITPDGRFIALASWPTVYVYDRSVPILRWSGAIGAGNDALAISGDGKYLAWGWTTFFLREWNGSSYTPTWTYDPPGTRYVGQCALSEDESNLAIAWDNGSGVPNEISVELYELPSLSLQWTHDYGSPSPEAPFGLTDIPTSMRFSTDGDHFAIGSWGGQFPELHVFERSSSTPVYSLDTPGSMIDMDIATSAGGNTYIATCGKNVHATIGGNGGDLYAIELAGGGTGIGERSLVSSSSGLGRNYPNPFVQQTTITYSLSRPGRVRLGLYDVQGRLVRELVDGPGAAGIHAVPWNGRGQDGVAVPAGVYLARLESAHDVSTRKILIVR